MAEFNFSNRVFSYTEGGSGSGCEGDCRECGCPEGDGCFPVSDTVVRNRRSLPDNVRNSLKYTTGGKRVEEGVAVSGSITYECIEDNCEDVEDGFAWKRESQEDIFPPRWQYFPASPDPSGVPDPPGLWRHVSGPPNSLVCVFCVPGPHGGTIVDKPIPCTPPLKPNATTVGRGGQNIAWPPGTGPGTHTVDTGYLTCPSYSTSLVGAYRNPPVVVKGRGTPCPIIAKPRARMTTVTSRAFGGGPSNNPTFAQPSAIVSNIKNETYTNQNLPVTTQADFDNTFGATDPNSVASVSYTSQPQSSEYSPDTLDGGTINSLAQSVDLGVLDSIIDHVAKNLCDNGGTYSLPPCGSGETFVISTGSCEPTNVVQVDTNGWPKDTLNNVVSRIDSRIQSKRKNKLLDILQSNNSITEISNIANAAEYVALTNNSLTQTQSELILQGVAELNSVWDDPNYATAEDHLAAVIKSMNKVKDNIGNAEIISSLNAINSSFTDVYTELLVDCESNTYPDSASVSVALALNEPYLLESAPLTLTLTGSNETSGYTRFRRPKPHCNPPKVFDFATNKCVCPDGYFNCDNAGIFGGIFKESQCIKCPPGTIIQNNNGQCRCGCPEGKTSCRYWHDGGFGGVPVSGTSFTPFVPYEVINCLDPCPPGQQRLPKCGACACIDRSSKKVPPDVLTNESCQNRIRGSIVDASKGCTCVCPPGKLLRECRGDYICADVCIYPKVWDSFPCACVCPPPSGIGGCPGEEEWSEELCECVCPSGVDCGSGSGEGGGEG